MMDVKKTINSLGLPRLIILSFLIVLCVTASFQGLRVADLASDVLLRFGMNGVLALAMVPAIQCGISLNFGVTLGILGGLVGSLISVEMGFTGVQSFVVAGALGVLFATTLGVLYGVFLNNLKGYEMTVSTYIGYSAVAIMNIGWLLLPFKSGNLKWGLGEGLRGTIDLTGSYGFVLSPVKMLDKLPAPPPWLAFKAFGIKVPLGLIIFFLVCCFLMHLFLRSKTGEAMSAAGVNPKFAESSGINVNKMRIIGTAISTALGAVGILTYSQSFGFLQLYNAPMYMGFAAIASVLIGGASVGRARISHVIIGTFLFQGIITVGLPVANKLLPEGNLSEVFRLIISNGIIIYAITKSQGGGDR